MLECGGAGNVEGCSPLQFSLQFYIERQALVGATILNSEREYSFFPGCRNGRRCGTILHRKAATCKGLQF